MNIVSNVQFMPPPACKREQYEKTHPHHPMPFVTEAMRPPPSSPHPHHLDVPLWQETVTSSDEPDELDNIWAVDR